MKKTEKKEKDRIKKDPKKYGRKRKQKRNRNEGDKYKRKSKKNRKKQTLRNKE